MPPSPKVKRNSVFKKLYLALFPRDRAAAIDPAAALPDDDAHETTATPRGAEPIDAPSIRAAPPSIAIQHATAVTFQTAGSEPTARSRSPPATSTSSVGGAVSNSRPPAPPASSSETPSPPQSARAPKLLSEAASMSHVDGNQQASSSHDPPPTETALARSRRASSQLGELTSEMPRQSGCTQEPNGEPVSWFSSRGSDVESRLSAGLDGTGSGLRWSRYNSLVENVNGLRTRVGYLTTQLAIAERESLVAVSAQAAAGSQFCALCTESVHPPAIVVVPSSPLPSRTQAVFKHDAQADAPRRWSHSGVEGAHSPLWPARRGLHAAQVHLQSTMEDATDAELESFVQSKAVQDLGLATSVPTTPRRGTRHRRARHELRTLVAKASEGAFARSRTNSLIPGSTLPAEPALDPTEIDVSRPAGAVTFADLELVRPLGSGTYGAVSLMRHASTSVFYAVKAVSKAHITASPSAAKIIYRLRRERNALFALRGHPCVLAVHGTAADATHVYLITEACMGGELQGLLTEGALPEEQAIFYCASVLLALEAAHRRGIVYRDLKPENVLLDSAGWVRLADFGAAAYIGAPTADAPAGRAMSRFGTVEYMSPEVARGDEAGHSLETDWWSFGAMLFELLVGRTPCVIDGSDAESDMVVLSRVAAGEVIWPQSSEPQLSPDADDLIAQLLTVDQERRLGSRTRGGAAGVRAHRFFERADFAAIVNRCYSYPPPWIPGLHRSDDTSFTPFHQDPGEYNSLREASNQFAYDGPQWERYFSSF
jgi:serine/threonine protein kinase